MSGKAVLSRKENTFCLLRMGVSMSLAGVTCGVIQREWAPIQCAILGRFPVGWGNLLMKTQRSNSKQRAVHRCWYGVWQCVIHTVLPLLLLLLLPPFGSGLWLCAPFSRSLWVLSSGLSGCLLGFRVFRRRQYTRHCTRGLGHHLANGLTSRALTSNHPQSPYSILPDSVELFSFSVILLLFFHHPPSTAFIVRGILPACRQPVVRDSLCADFQPAELWRISANDRARGF